MGLVLWIGKYGRHQCSTSHLRRVWTRFTFTMAESNAPQHKMEMPMTWKTPTIVEVSVGMEINMYACAARK